MDTLESVDKSAVSRVPRPQGVFLVGSVDVFEAVFESARLSADRLAEVMA